MKKLILVFGLAASLTSCLKDKGSSCTATNSTTVAPASEVTYLQNYCASNAPAAVAHPSGLYYEVLTPGSGDTAVICSNVTVRYSGYLLGSATAFETSSVPVTFPLANVIVGWQKGIPKVRKGGSIRLFIPPTLAYGPGGSPPTIPPNSYLKFDVQVDDIK